MEVSEQRRDVMEGMQHRSEARDSHREPGQLSLFCSSPQCFVGRGLKESARSTINHVYRGLSERLRSIGFKHMLLTKLKLIDTVLCLPFNRCM